MTLPGIYKTKHTTVNSAESESPVASGLRLKIHGPVFFFFSLRSLAHELLLTELYLAIQVCLFSSKIEEDLVESLELNYWQKEKIIRPNSVLHNTRAHFIFKIICLNYLPKRLRHLLHLSYLSPFSCYFPALFSTLPARKSLLLCSYAK